MIITCEHCGREGTASGDQHTCTRCADDGHSGPGADCEVCECEGVDASDHDFEEDL